MNEKVIQAKINSVLNVKVNYSDSGIMTRREFCELCKKKGCKSETKLDHPFDWNRTKYNRMNNEQGEEYERKYNQLVVKYRLINPTGTIYVVSKTEYDYFNSLPSIIEKSGYEAYTEQRDKQIEESEYNAYIGKKFALRNDNSEYITIKTIIDPSPESPRFGYSTKNQIGYIDLADLLRYYKEYQPKKPAQTQNVFQPQLF